MTMRPGTAAIAGVLAFLALPMTAQAYSTLYVFGDSLSDAGNVFLATHMQQPAAPYANGQYSNGPTWVQDLAGSLGLGPVTASLAGGTDYAYGGSTTGYAVPGPTAAVPTLTAQITLFSSAVGGVAPSTALYAVWSGANDLFAILSDGLAKGALDSTQAVQAAAEAAGVEAGAIATLATAGAKTFVVPLLPDLGKTPDIRAAGASAAATALSATYNAALIADIQALVAGTSISVSLVDTFSLIDAAVSTPNAYGFTDVTAPCYSGPYTGGGSGCRTQDQYLFWDSVHPTAAGHAIIAAAAEAALPEPGTLAVLAFGLIGLGALRTGRSPIPLPIRHVEAS
ncbi:MAG: SGNH/GDSL hydrolase family protein [Rhodopila sp.]